MKIIICGAGLSGRAIAEKLSQIGNEVTIIDSSKKLIEKLGNKLDIRGIVGHGAHPDILGEAGAEDAEMLISVTPSDEINMMACQVAHSLFEVPLPVGCFEGVPVPVKGHFDCSFIISLLIIIN